MRTRCCRTVLAFFWLCGWAVSVHAQSAPVLTSLTLTPTRITGGTPASGTVTLSSAAGSQAAAVALSSSDTAVVIVPASVTVPPGSITQTFSLETRPVTAETVVIISATRLGVTRSATLTVLPPGSSEAAPQLSVEVGASVLGQTGALGSPRPTRATVATAEAVLPEGTGGGGGTEEDRDESPLRGIADDGSLFVADSGGTALVRLGTETREILLDTTSQDPVDGVGLARLLQVETNRNGTSAVLALRADNSRGVYRLENGRLTRLSLLPDETDRAEGDRIPVELAISDSGQIAYVARTPSGDLGVFQTGGTGGELLPVQQVLGGAKVLEVSHLQSNATGDLVFLINPGDSNAAILRKTRAGVAVVAKTGQVVERGRRAGVTGTLSVLRRPRIGPDGTVVFLGADSPVRPSFVNFFVARPDPSGSSRLEPLLPGSEWNLASSTYDEAVAGDGTVGVRAAPASTSESVLYLIGPAGLVRRVDLGSLLPGGRPVFAKRSGDPATEWRLFFLAEDIDRPIDQEGRFAMGLYRARVIEGRPASQPAAVAVAGQALPGEPGAQLLEVTAAPAVSSQAVAFVAQFGALGPHPVPVTGYFRTALEGTVAEGGLLAEEGTALPGANRLAVLRHLSFQGNGTLVFGGLQPGAGPLIASLQTVDSAVKAAAPSGSGLATGRAVAPRLAAATTVEPLLAMGQSLDRPDRRLLAILSPPIALAGDRQLFAARFAPEGGVSGEGLFTIDQNKQVRALAATGDPVPGISGARFVSFADPPSAAVTTSVDCSPFASAADSHSVGSPSVYADANGVNVVFKARLEQGGATTFAVFQWTGTALTVVGLSDPQLDNDSLKLSAEDRPPYELLRWAAGMSGRAYLMVRHRTSTAAEVTRLLERSATGVRLLAVSGTTAIAGGSLQKLVDLYSFIATGQGDLFVSGKTVDGTGKSVLGVFRVEPGGLSPLVLQGQPMPPFADGRAAQGYTFTGRFGLMPDSVRGNLLFRAELIGRYFRRGLFRLGPQGVEALVVEELGVAGARDLTIETLSEWYDKQAANGTTVFSTHSKAGGWVLFRSQSVRDSGGRVSFTTVPIAQERNALRDVPRFATLDPAQVLSLPCRSGPVFSLNDAGAVACLASNGQRWGIYLLPNRQ